MADPNVNKYLSKINLGGQDYLLKDAELRQTVADLQAAGLEIIIKDSAWISDVSNAEKSRGKLILVAEEGSETGTYVEYVAVNAGAGTEKANWIFERIGTTAADLTDYVKTTRKVAGLALEADITVEALQGALKLGKLAYKDNAEGTVAQEVIKGVKATGNVDGSATITYDDAAQATVNTKKVAGPTITKTSGAAAKITNKTVDMTKNESGAIQIEGSVAAPTLHIAANTKNISEMFTAGELPKWKANPFTAATLNNTEVKFAKEGMKASVAPDSETLKIENVLTANAMDGLTFNGGAFDQSQFDAGTKSTVSGTVATGMGECTADAPAFTGAKYDLALNSDGITVTADAQYSAAQIDAVDTIVYSKANSSATVSAEGVSLDVGDITVAEKKVTVQ